MVLARLARRYRNCYVWRTCCASATARSRQDVKIGPNSLQPGSKRSYRVTEGRQTDVFAGAQVKPEKRWMCNVPISKFPKPNMPSYEKPRNLFFVCFLVRTVPEA